MAKQHEYTSKVIWTGDRGLGTSTYDGYDRTWQISIPSKAIIECSNDPLLGGDPSKPNPEDLLLSSLSACHMLWYLHLASAAKIVVRAYEDEPIGLGETGAHGEGRFLEAILRPTITVDSGTDIARADALHHEVHAYCFISRSVNFPVTCTAQYVQA